MDKNKEITVTLLSCTLTITAHKAAPEGGLRYSAAMRDGMNKIMSHHFAFAQAYVNGNRAALVMDNSEIPLHDGAALLIEEFLRNTASFVSAPCQLSLSIAREVA